MYGVMVWINVRMNMDMVWSDCAVSKKLDVKLLKVWNHGHKYECMVVMVWINDVQCMKTNMVWYHTWCMYEQNSRFGKKYEIIPWGMMFSPVFFWWHSTHTKSRPSRCLPAVCTQRMHVNIDSGPGPPLPRVTCYGSPASSRLVLARAAACRA